MATSPNPAAAIQAEIDRLNGKVDDPPEKHPAQWSPADYTQAHRIDLMNAGRFVGGYTVIDVIDMERGVSTSLTRAASPPSAWRFMALTVRALKI